MFFNIKLIYCFIVFLIVSCLNSALSQEIQIENRNSFKVVKLLSTYSSIQTNNNMSGNNSTKIAKVTHIYHNIILAKNQEPFKQNGLEDDFKLSSYPLPANDNVELSINSNYECGAEINLYSIEGTLQLSKDVKLKLGLNYFNFDLKTIVPGIYYFIVNSNNNYSALKLLVLR